MPILNIDRRISYGISAGGLVPAGVPDEPLNLVTDFGGSFAAWNTYLQDANRFSTLIVPAGSYDMAGSAFSFYGPGSDIIGAGPTTTFLSNPGAATTLQAQPDPGQPYPRIATVGPGSSTITLLDLGDVSRFIVGRWINVVSFDIQAFGYPQNNQFYEYRQIVGVNVGTGVITLDRPLTKTFKQTYPLYFAGNVFEKDQCGPASAILLEQGWNTDVTVRNVTITGSGPFFGTGRLVTYENCIFESWTPIPSQNVRWTCRNCTFDGTVQLEVDKFIEEIVFDNCIMNITGAGLIVASGCAGQLTMTDCTVTNMGTPFGATLTNCSIDTLVLGPSAYGVGKDVVITDCDVTSFAPQNNFRAVGVTPSTQYAAGVFTFPRATVTGTDILLDVIPDHPMILGKTGIGITGPVFTVTDVTADATNVYYQTDLGSNPDATAALAYADRIYCHACPALTVTNSTGAIAYLSTAAAAGRPAGSYYYSGLSGTDFTFDSNAGDNSPNNTSLTPGIMFGALERITVRVLTPYTGVQGVLKVGIAGLFNNGITLYDSSWSPSTYGPQFDLKTAGTRVITQSGVTGSTGADSITAWGATYRWLLGGGGLTLPDISGESSSVWPVFDVEILYDQGI